jgi:hypothetical protein
VSPVAPAWRWAGVAAGLLVGAAIGLLGAFVQAQRLLVGSVGLPWGVALVWVALLLAVRAGAWAVGTRWAAWAVTVGWLVVSVLLSAESPSGDVAISGGGRQLTYLIGGVILASAAATMPLPRSRRAP